MDGKLKVTPERLIEASDSFRSTNSTVRATTDEMVSVVNSLKGTWQGEAADAFNSKFLMLQDDMDKIHRMIDEHVRDLQEMAEQYQLDVEKFKELAGEKELDAIKMDVKMNKALKLIAAESKEV